MVQTDPDNLRADQATGHPHPPLPFDVSGPADLQALRRQWAERGSVPCLVPSRQHALDHSWPGMDVRTLLTGDNSSGRQSFHDIIVAPGAGLPAHARSDGHTYWFVVSGQADMTIGAVRETVEPGGFGYAPPETTQAVLNHGTSPVRLFVCYLPAGADRAFGEAHALWRESGGTEAAPYLAVLQKYGFDFDLSGPQPNDAYTNDPVERVEADIKVFADFQALRDTWSRRQPIPKLVRTDSRLADSGWGTAGTVTLVGGDDTSGCASMFTGEAHPNHSAPFHHQPSEEEAFFVLDGKVSLTCGSETALIGPGAFGFAPRYATHGFTNVGNVVSRMITFNSPSGHERGFEMMIRERAAPTGDFMSLMAAHGWQLHSNVNPPDRSAITVEEQA